MSDDAIPLRDHFEALLAAERRASEQRFSDSQAAIQAALASAEKAVEKSEREARQWRDNANEWRAAMTDREARFVSVELHAALVKQIDDLKQWKSRATGVVAVALPFAGVVGAALMRAFTG